MAMTRCTIGLCLALPSLCQTPGEATISGKITDALTHQPIAGASVNYCCSVRGYVNSDANGAYSFHLTPDDSVGYLTVSKKGYATFDQASSERSLVHLRPGVAETRDFELSPSAHITGRLTDRDSGNPLAGFIVIAALQKSQYSIMASAKPTNTDGSFAIIADLNPGNYILEIDPPSGERISAEKESEAGAAPHRRCSSAPGRQ
jgi:hypothetical protein